MSTMQSTIQRIAAEEATQKPVADDGWQPAGPVLIDNEAAMREMLGAQENLRQLGIPPEPTTNIPQNIPSIAHLVVYHLREGDSRNRRTKFPAIVMDVDAGTGLLKLWVIVDDGDTWMQDLVPARQGSEPGWEVVTGADLEAIVAEATEVFVSRVAALEDRITALEHTAEVLGKGAGIPDALTTKINGYEDRIAALEAKRGPGRPPLPKG